MLCVRPNLMRRFLYIKCRPYSDKITGENRVNIPEIPIGNNSIQDKYEFVPVFYFPLVSRIAMISRIKIYQIMASTVAVPVCGILEFLEKVPELSTAMAAYVGITATALLSLVSLPTVNIIGVLYISTDKQKIKISYVDFWGRRNNRVIDVDDWIPLMSIPKSKTDFLYLKPHLADGTKYKLFLKYGQLLNEKAIGEILE